MSNPDSTRTVTDRPSLYERLGARAAVEAVVDRFYFKVLADPALAPFFEARDVGRLRTKQEAFLTEVFGGPKTFNGAGLRAAHAPLVRRGLGEVHFRAVAGHLTDTLQALGVAPELVQEVLELVAATRTAVLGLEPGADQARCSA